MTASSGIAAEEAPAAPIEQTSGHGFSWYTVYMTALVAVMSQIDRGVLALFVQPIKRDYHLTDTQVSFLLGFAFTFFYVVGGPPLSRMADRGVRKTVIAGCLAVWSVATTCCAIAQGFWGFFAARAVIGASESGCGPASLSMISDAVPREKLPMAYAVYNSGFGGGAALSLVLGGVLLGALKDVQPIHVAGLGVIYNWQIVFLILGIPGLLISAFYAMTVREPRRLGGGKPGGHPMREVARAILAQRSLHIPLMLGILCMNFQLYGLGSWMPAFYERTYGWGPAIVGPLIGTTGLIVGVVGLFLGARVAEWLGKRYDDANVRLFFIVHVSAMPLGLIAPLMPSPWLAMGCNAVAGLISAMGGPAYNAAINIATPNAMRSQVNALYFIVMNAVAGSLGPTLVALVTDNLMHSEADLRYVIFGFRLVLGPLSAFLIWHAIAPYGRIYRQRLQEGA